MRQLPSDKGKPMGIDTAVRHPAESKITIERMDSRFARLKDIVVSQSLLKGDFVLTSGRKSSYLFQLRQTTLHPEGACLLGDIIVDFMKREGLDHIGGLAVGAVPLVTAVALVSHQKNYPVSAFFVRKAAKEHGAKELIDGYVAEASRPLIVDDVATTGGSILKAVEALREKKCVVTTALSIVDRQEGAAENLAKSGIQLFSIFRKSDFTECI
jgi:orotate phosphoribosyltransferase